MAVHLDPVAALEAPEHGVEMLVVDAAQTDFVIGVVVLENQRGIFLGQALKRARQLDIVLAVGGLDRDHAIARRIFDLDRRRELAGAEPIAGSDAVDLRDRDDVAGERLVDLLRLFALDLEQRPDARVIAPAGLEVRTFADVAAEDPRHRQPADRPVHDLEHIERRIAD